MKTCIACKYVHIEPHYAYSTLTQGGDTINCNKGHFFVDIEDAQIMCLSQATECEDYELSDLAKSKGWTE